MFRSKILFNKKLKTRNKDFINNIGQNASSNTYLHTATRQFSIILC